jgi:hypothetical protein
VAADDRAIQDDRAHADERFVADDAGMDDGAVADRHVIAHAAGQVVFKMQDGVVLDVGVMTDDNLVYIAAQNCVVPHTGVIAEINRAHNDGAARNVNTRADPRLAREKRIQAFVKGLHENLVWNPPNRATFLTQAFEFYSSTQYVPRHRRTT